MKKINDKQKAVIGFFKSQLRFWENTNDIDSLTHYSDIGEELRTLDDNLSIDYTSLTSDELEKIESVARILYQTIKGIRE